MTRYAYQAIGWIDNRAAGHVVYGTTKEECRARARRRTTVSIIVHRVRVTSEHYDQIAAGAADSDSLAHRI
jgi:hypothetical protein